MGRGFSGVGDFRINGQDLDIEGVTSFDGGEFNRVTVNGVASVKNELKANEIEIDGVFNASGEVLAKHITVDGVSNFKGNLRCQEAEIDGVLNLKGGKLEAETLSCDGTIKSEGEINADRIEADGCISAREIYGDKICIHSVSDTFHIGDGVQAIVSGVNSLLRSLNIDRREVPATEENIAAFRKMQNSRIGTLEATEIEIEYTDVTRLAGNDVTIGEGCYVENVDCDGILRVSKNAVVKNVTGSHEYQTID